uniref:Putative transmembrane protein n=1 Tax=Toxoplasma gondii COUG TaxID=1074873 RepID=A0A2G8Y5I3_TOXGO|nr:putative transmembrane protein [Toxoplasma gondii COUG]
MSGSTARGTVTLVLPSVTSMFVRFVLAGESPGCANAAECARPLSAKSSSSHPQSVWKSYVCAFLPPPFHGTSSSLPYRDMGSSSSEYDPSHALVPFVYLLFALLLADGIVTVLKRLWCVYKHQLRLGSPTAEREGAPEKEGKKDGLVNLAREHSDVRHRCRGRDSGKTLSPGPDDELSGQSGEHAEAKCSTIAAELQQLRAEQANAGRVGTANFVAQAKLQRRIIRLEQQLAGTQKNQQSDNSSDDKEHRKPDASFLTKPSGLGSHNSTLLRGVQGFAAQLGGRLVASAVASLFKAAFCYAMVSIGCQWSSQRDVAQHGWTLILPTRFLWPFFQNSGSQWCGFGFMVPFFLGRLAVDELYRHLNSVGLLMS